jgi:hypothetical protein
MLSRICMRVYTRRSSMPCTPRRIRYANLLARCMCGFGSWNIPASTPNTHAGRSTPRATPSTTADRAVVERYTAKICISTEPSSDYTVKICTVLSQTTSTQTSMSSCTTTSYYEQIFVEFYITNTNIAKIYIHVVFRRRR